MHPDPSRPTNRLAGQSSPYLLQHADQPVDWYPWGRQAFAAARQQQKPILLSIGYSTCHWCHVMARESFADLQTAEILNRHFISIKVDREERPDIDIIYMTAVSALTGSAGWPLNVFLTPDRQPFFGGTYFPPKARPGIPAWPDLLRAIAKAWQQPDQREKLLRSAADITRVIATHLTAPPVLAPVPDAAVLDAAQKAWASAYDPVWGGFGTAPKFPSACILDFLLTSCAASRSDAHRAPAQMAADTLRFMANGGIRDRIGGGFHRYATDRRWHVPHFEKMLYDNAQLTVNYINAYRLTDDRFFADVAAETADYVLRELAHPDGGFFSAEDADSLPASDRSGPKVEGAYYVWTYREIFDILEPRTAAIVADHWDIRPDGNVRDRDDPHGTFTGKNILRTAGTVDETAARFNLTAQTVESVVHRAAKRLFDVRSQRPRPHLDDKILCAWNGLMIGALARLYRTVGGAHYRTAAQRAATFLYDRLYEPADTRLFRVWRNGQRKVSGLAADYAFVVQGILDLYEIDTDRRWLNWAIALSDAQLGGFSDPHTGTFFMTRADHDRHLPLRVRADTDNVLPAAASVTVTNLLRLSQMAERKDFAAAARKTLQAAASGIRKHPTASPQMLSALSVAIDQSSGRLPADAKPDDRTGGPGCTTTCAL